MPPSTHRPDDEAQRAAGLHIDPVTVGTAAVPHAPASIPREDSYHIAGEIARGGMGVILRAEDRKLGRDVAMKVLHRSTTALADDASVARIRDRFVAEARITGQLEHPNIVPVHDLGLDADGRLFFTMKLVRGRSLADLLADVRRNRPDAPSLTRLLGIFHDVCDAVAFAHSRGVVHRDLKPANIMVGDYGETLVMDWGLARDLRRRGGSAGCTTARTAPVVALDHVDDPFADELQTLVASFRGAGNSEDGVVEGTPAYMPPEQARGDIALVDERSDIYALGAILYEIICQRPPVGGKDLQDILDHVIAGRVLAPERRVPERSIPAELSAIAMQCLATDPAKRYATVGDLQRDIERFLDHKSVSAKEDTAIEALVKLVKRNNGAAIATAIGLVALLAVGGVSWWTNLKSRHLAENQREIAEVARQQADIERERAALSLASLQEEQRRRLKDQQASAPALIEKARRAIERRDFNDARNDLDLALQFNRGLDEARILRAQIMAVQDDPAGAANELEALATAEGADRNVRDLRDVCVRAAGAPSSSAVAKDLADVLYRLGSRTLADQAAGQTKELVAIYRSTLEQSWRKLPMERFRATREGKLEVGCLRERRDVVDLGPLKNMPVAGIDLYRTGVEDLAPLTGAPLASLEISETRIAHLEPVAEAPLVEVRANRSQVADLNALAGDTLEVLELAETPVADLGPLAHCPRLRRLILRDCPGVVDLSPLAGLPLAELDLAGTGVADLGPLAASARLETLRLTGCAKVTDLSPLASLRLATLAIERTGVRDLGPLKDVPLTSIAMTETSVTDLAALTGRRLRELNLSGLQVSDLTPLAGMESLLVLRLDGTLVTSLKPLARNVRLTTLTLSGTRVADLGPLRDMPLNRLDADRTSVADLRPLAKAPLVSLNLESTQVADLDALKGLAALRELNIANTPVQRLDALKGMGLLRLSVTPKALGDSLRGIRDLPSLAQVGVVKPGENGWGRMRDPSDALRRFEAGEFR